MNNEQVRETIHFMVINMVLCDYNNIKVDILTSEGVAMLYWAMSSYFLSNFVYKHSYLYADMKPSESYLA